MIKILKVCNITKICNNLCQQNHQDTCVYVCLTTVLDRAPWPSIHPSILRPVMHWSISLRTLLASWSTKYDPTKQRRHQNATGCPPWGFCPLVLTDLDRKKWTFILETLLAKKIASSFSTNFNMFQACQSICTFSVSGEFGLAEPEEIVWFMPLAKASLANMFIARLLH